MESISFYTQQEINLEAIAICAMRSGFKTSFAPLAVTRLMVEYVFELDGEHKTGTWAFQSSDIISLSETEPELLGDFELKAVKELKPASVFSIYFRSYSFARLVSFLEALLQCFEGWIVSHETGQYYSTNNIKALASECSCK